MAVIKSRGKWFDNCCHTQKKLIFKIDMLTDVFPRSVYVYLLKT